LNLADGARIAGGASIAVAIRGLRDLWLGYIAAPASRGQPMSAEDDCEKSREGSLEWHRARAEQVRKNGFTKMAQEHEQNYVH
jgi:hypothetical protein